MRRLRAWWQRWRGEAAGTFGDELQFHLEARASDLEAGGLSPEDARAQARREFGDISGARRAVGVLDRRTAVRRWRRHMVIAWGHDVRYAVRRLRRSPAFTAAVLLTFALGIGANASVYSVIKGVLLEPLALPRPAQLYSVYSANLSAGIDQASVSAVDLDDWRAARRDIEDIGGYLYAADATGVDLYGRGAPRRLSAVFITPGFLSALGVTPAAGRLPREDELVRGGPDRIVLLTEGFWTREFGRDPAVIGGAVTLNHEPYVVIGVLPASLQFPTEAADVFVPLSTIPDSGIPRIRPVRILDVVARAREGVTQEQVRTEMALITARLATEYPDDQAWGHATVVPLAETITGAVRNSLWIVFGAVAFVLLMACVNVTSLQLARISSQVRDLSVASALGATRGRLLRQMLTEGILLSLGGGGIGVGLAMLGTAALPRLASGQLPRATGIHVDATVVILSLVTSMAAGVLSSLIPALRATRAVAPGVLQAAGRGVTGGESPRLRATLVVAEVAVAMILAVGAGLMTRTLSALLHVNPGFQPDHLIAAQFTIDDSRHGGAGGAPPGIGHGSPFTGYYTDVIARVRQTPGVVSAGAVKDAPFRGSGERIGISIPGQPVPPGQDPPLATAIHVSDGYFQTIGATIVDGREFSPNDRSDTPFVLVVNEAFAKRFFPGQRAVGQHLSFGPVQPEIVGVVGDISQRSLAEPARPTVYVDNLQNSRVKTTIVARTVGEPAEMATALRQAIWAVDANQPIADVFTFTDAMRRSLAAPRFLTLLLATFGLLGALIGTVGVYGLLASLVSRRRRELAVRVALGATQLELAKAVVWQGIALGGIGVAIGIAGAVVLSRFLAAVLFEVAALDPLTFTSTAAGLVAAVVVASWLPARRAAHVDPAEVLRA